MVYGYNDEERLLTPMIRKEGKLVPVSYEEAAHKAAQILTDAKYPLLFGWSSSTSEAQRIGVALAEELGSALDNTCSICHGPSVMATQEVGIPTCTLGQIRHRADLIIYWACDPWSAHPRHLERYTSFTEGRFEKSEYKGFIQKMKAGAGKKKLDAAARRGEFIKYQPAIPQQTCTVEGPPASFQKQGRKLIVVDVRKTMTADAADYFLQVEPNKDYEVIEALRALINDKELDVDKVGGVPVEYLQEIADAMVNCEFGVIFFGLGLTQTVGRFRNIEIAIKLTRDLNKKTKFVILPMRGHFNVTGANVVFAWQTGYPYAIDFSQGYPQFNPGEFTAIDLLKRGDNDATLVISSDPGAHFPKPAVQNLVKKPLIVIDPHMNCTSMLGDVVFPTQWCGIEYEGTAYRMDHVPIMLRKVVDPPPGILNDEQILEKILAEVKTIKAQKAGQTPPENHQKTTAKRKKKIEAN
jgi:formylmethanofuran dehydrogenase subunit B